MYSQAQYSSQAANGGHRYSRELPAPRVAALDLPTLRSSRPGIGGREYLWRWGLLVSLLFLSVSRPAETAVLLMSNGDRLTGTVESWGDGILTFETEYAGIIEVSWDKVDRLSTDNDVSVLTVDDELINGKLVLTPERAIQLQRDTGEVQTVAEADLARINPEPWRLGRGAKHSGHVDFSLKSDRGNTQQNEIDFDIDYSARRKADRWSFFGEFEYDTSEDETTKNRWQALGKYDWFVNDKRYYTFNAFVEQDEKKGLDLRYYVGPGIGYQFYEGEDKNLRAEWAVMYTSSDLSDRGNKTSIGTGWHINYDQFLYRRFVQAYHRQSAVLSNRENMNFKSKTGLRFPIGGGFLASGELEANWDAETAENSDKTELIYRIKLGYGW